MNPGLTIDDVKQAMGDILIDFKVKEKQYIALLQQRDEELNKLREELKQLKGSNETEF